MPADLSSSSAATGLQSPIRGLHATPTAPLPFLDGVVVRSFVLEREQGNVIIYNSPGITAAKRDILALGRPDRLLVNPWHEAMYGAPDLDAPIFVHEADRGQTDLPITGTFSKRGRGREFRASLQSAPPLCGVNGRLRWRDIAACYPAHERMADGGKREQAGERPFWVTFASVD